ncbi:MAG: PQQ-dependent sugar dehydrogenase [Chloroflexi bacterium]|nr:PQQ-dependent sugar dehydrogenase [Chloroflexota bacterium]
MNKRIFLIVLLIPALSGILGLGLARPVFAAPPRVVTWPPITLDSFVGGLSQPVALTHANDNSGRIFVNERTGTIRIIQSSVLLTTPFLNIGPTGANRVGSTGSEQGLLGLAFPPGFASKNQFYVYYTNLTGSLVIARYNVSANPNLADVNSEQILLTIPHPTYQNHDGGQLQFGADGFLYIGTGDGGSGGDPNNNAQNPNSLLGKLLRINVEPPSQTSGSSINGSFVYFFPFIAKLFTAPLTYTIPTTNPFTQTVGYRGEIWAVGLRNPWRFSFDRQTNDLYIGDVGQNQWEEIDFQPASSAGGENYGWRILEGTHCYNPSSGCVAPSAYSAPVAEYSHSLGCSVTGGYVYRGSISAMQGIYFYGDYCSGRIWGLQKDGATWVTQQLKQQIINISTFGEDQAGNLYVGAYDGTIYQITSP